jgi:two-component system, cell cycle sensor histidine kinase and response regulator CckA
MILDMVMPDMGGEETFDALLSSGYSIEGRPSDLLAQGCNGFIQKLFTMRELSSKIRQVLKKE